MSILNDDKRPLEARSDALEGAEAPLRDQVVKKLYDKLEELGIGQKIADMWARCQSDRVDTLKRHQAYLDTIDNFLPGSTDGSYDGSSQVHLPVAFAACKAMHARMFQAIMGMDPPFHVKARNQASLERVQPVSDTIRYYVQDGSNYGKGVEQTVDRWLWDWVTIGVGLKKWRWDVKYSRYIDVREVPEQGPPRYAVDEEGKQVLIPTIKMVEKEVPVSHKCFDGPVCELIDYEDLGIIGGGGDPDLADAVLHREWLTASQLWTLADRKVFNEEAVRAVIDSGRNYKNGSLGSDIKDQRASNAGQTVQESEAELDRYEIVEAHLKICVDDSGIDSDVIAWIHLQTKELLRATFLYRVSPSGERPFVKIVFQPQKNQESALGLVGLVYPLAQEMDAIHNMRVDWGMLSVMPFGFYRPTSGIDPKVINYEPGTLIPVDNPQTDVFFPNLGNRTVFGFQEEQALLTYVERITSLSDINFGVIGGGQGATRTATGARMVNGEMSSNLDVYLRRLNVGWKKSLRYLLGMLQQRIPAGLSFRLTGQDGKEYWREIKNARDLEGNFDIEVLPNSASSNQQILIDTAQQILQLTSNPMDIQLGIIGPQERYEAIKNYLQALGVKDFGRYLVKIDPTSYTVKLTPIEEADLILHGIKVPMNPQADHEGFINWWEMAKNDDQILGQWNQDQAMALERQAMAHAEMLQALEQMRAQQANTAQMRSNAAQSQQQAPVGMAATQQPGMGAAQ